MTVRSAFVVGATPVARLRRLWRFAIAFAAALSAAALTAASAVGASGSLTLQILPGLLAPGGSGAVVATFTNNGSHALQNVTLKIALPPGTVFDATNSSPMCADVESANCGLGIVGPGASVVVLVGFDTVPVGGPITVTGIATWGRHVPAGPGDATSVTARADVFALPPGFEAVSDCHVGGDTLEADSAGGQGTQVKAGANAAGLPCTPILAGVAPSPVPSEFSTDVSFVKLPALREPATVVLTFPRGHVPGSSDSPGPLQEFPAYPDTSTIVPVPLCQGQPPTFIPAGSDSCIAARDVPHGTITLRVRGRGSDPGYIG